MFVVSFYSYKGGVGRSVALLNTAWNLTLRGWRVAVLDLDLEAPGLHKAPLQPGPNASWLPPAPKAGFAELVARHQGQDAVSDWPGDYLVDGLGPDGRLGLLAARGEGMATGRDYEQFLQRFSWADFYLEGNGRGFMEGLVKGISALGFDYLLLDARTGHTDVAGITLLHLPDAAVLVTNLSEQSVAGIQSQLGSLREVNQECRTAAGSRRRRPERRHTPISIVLVASPLPSGDLVARQQRLADVQRMLGSRIDVVVDYLPHLALAEGNQILAQQLGSPAAEAPLAGAARPFERLVEQVVSRNPAAPENLLAEGEELSRIGRWREALAHFDEVQDRLPAQEKAWARLRWEALHQKAHAQLQALNVRAAHASFDQLQSLAARDRWDERALLARGKLALSWAYVVLNDPPRACGAARQAQELLCAGETAGEEEALRAEIQLCLGQALSFAGDWIRAAAELEAGAQICHRLGTLQLVECLTLAELVRARLRAATPPDAATALARAWERAGLVSSSTATAQVARRIASSYVHARLLLARAELACDAGRGLAAEADLMEAFAAFHRDGDETSQVEAVAVLAGVAGMLPYEGRIHPAATACAFWRRRADRLRMSASSLRLRILESIHQQPGEVPARSRSAMSDPRALTDVPQAELQAQLCLCVCRDILVEPGPLSSGFGDLIKAAKLHLDRAPSPQSEVEHEIALLAGLGAIAVDCFSWHRLAEHAAKLHRDGFARREAQARVVLALADPRAHLPALRQALAALESPSRWLWNLPLAFLDHTPRFTAHWQPLRSALAEMWPDPRAPVASPATRPRDVPGNAGRRRSRKPRTRLPKPRPAG